MQREEIAQLSDEELERQYLLHHGSADEQASPIYLMIGTERDRRGLGRRQPDHESMIGGEIRYVSNADAFGRWMVSRQGFRWGETNPWYTLLLGVFGSLGDAQQCIAALTTEHTAWGNGIGHNIRPK